MLANVAVQLIVSASIVLTSNARNYGVSPRQSVVNGAVIIVVGSGALAIAWVLWSSGATTTPVVLTSALGLIVFWSGINVIWRRKEWRISLTDDALIVARWKEVIFPLRSITHVTRVPDGYRLYAGKRSICLLDTDFESRGAFAAFYDELSSRTGLEIPGLEELR